MKERYFKVGKNDLYITENENLNTFCINAYVLAGSMYEEKYENGISHCYEHMVFRNLKGKYEEDIYELMSRNGIFLEGCTYKEFMYFSIYGITEGFDFALDILSEMFSPLEISEREFKAEKGRIKAEIRENDEKSTADYFHSTFAWKGTSLAMTITGNTSSVEKLTLSKLNRFRDKVISEGNIFFYATGNLDEEKRKKLINKVSEIEISKSCLKRKNRPKVPSSFGKRKDELTLHVKKGDSDIISISFDIDHKKCTHKEAQLIYSILFLNEDAACFQALSEKTGVIYSYDSSLEEYENISMIKLTFEVDKEDILSAIKTLVEELEKIKKGTFNFEVNICKNITNQIMMIDSPCDLNWAIAYENHILKSYKADFNKRGFGQYESITKEDVTRAAGDIFTLDNLCIAFKGKRWEYDFDQIKVEFERLNF